MNEEQGFLHEDGDRTNPLMLNNNDTLHPLDAAPAPVLTNPSIHDLVGQRVLQARFLYNALFSEDECQEIKSFIQSNLYNYIGILVEESLNKRRMKYTDQLVRLGQKNKPSAIYRSGQAKNEKLRHGEEEHTFLEDRQDDGEDALFEGCELSETNYISGFQWQ